MDAHVRAEEIDRWLASLSQSLKVVAPLETASLRRMHAEERYTDMVGETMRRMHIHLGVRVGYIKSGGSESTPAYVQMPERMPPFGTDAFRRTKVTMFIRRSFLAQAHFEAALSAIGHEASHVVLNSIGHPLRGQEEAVDLTTMMLGLADTYCAGCEYNHRTEKVAVDWRREPIRALINLIEPEKRPWSTRLGYLHPSEISYAAQRIALLRR